MCQDNNELRVEGRPAFRSVFQSGRGTGDQVGKFVNEGPGMAVRDRELCSLQHCSVVAPRLFFPRLALMPRREGSASGMLL
jgi:hypothetical protein